MDGGNLAMNGGGGLLAPIMERYRVTAVTPEPVVAVGDGMLQAASTRGSMRSSAAAIFRR